MVEQRDPEREVDIPTLRAPEADPPESWTPSQDADGGGAGVLMLEAAPPRVQTVAVPDGEFYAGLGNRLAVRHVSGDVPVAYIEIVSPGNKNRTAPVDAFCGSVAEAIDNLRHFLVIDILPPTRSAPRGMHAAYWERHVSEHVEPVPEESPLCSASYSANTTRFGVEPHGYINTAAVGDPLPEMPVFLTPRHYVNVPLEETYEETWRATPGRVKERVLASAG